MPECLALAFDFGWSAAAPPKPKLPRLAGWPRIRSVIVGKGREPLTAMELAQAAERVMEGGGRGKKAESQAL